MSEDEDELYDYFPTSKNMNISPIQENSATKEDGAESSGMGSLESATLEENTNEENDLNPRALTKTKTMQLTKKPKNNLQSRLSIKVPNFGKVLDGADLFSKQEPMTARSKP